jgi:hypothetical protein
MHRLLASASALRERQTRREAGAQSLRASHQEEVAGLPNSEGGGATMLRPQREVSGCRCQPHFKHSHRPRLVLHPSSDAEN